MRGEDLPICAAIVVAAGAGVRMGGGAPKAFIPLGGRPMAAWALDALVASGRVDRVIVAGPQGGLDAAREALGAEAGDADLVEGGASRAESVREGLRALPAGCDRVLVHDAARPLVSPELVAAVLDGIEGADGAIAAAPVADTLKREGEGGLIAGTVARAGLWAAQTPQAFRTAALRAAVEAAERAGTLADATDCAALVEAAGGRVRLVPATGPNLKVTTPADLALAEALLAARG
jgi:2-C-methyl-D-erythritol 4-phosphate cytidylyltransferase